MMMITTAESSSSPFWLSDISTGIRGEDDALTDGEEEELQFHIELGKTLQLSLPLNHTDPTQTIFQVVATWLGRLMFEDV